MDASCPSCYFCVERKRPMPVILVCRSSSIVRPRGLKGREFGPECALMSANDQPNPNGVNVTPIVQEQSYV